MNLPLIKQVSVKRFMDLLNIPQGAPIIIDIRNVQNQNTERIIKEHLRKNIHCFLCSSNSMNDPYGISRIEKENLSILNELRKEHNIRTIFEISSNVDLISNLCDFDMIVIGSNNMQNYELLKTVGRLHSPILLMRGLVSTLEEWLSAAEYVLAGGNDQICLCENGVRTSDPNRNLVLDLASVAYIKKNYRIPILVNLCNIAASQDIVISMARASICAGADGLITRAT